MSINSKEDLKEKIRSVFPNWDFEIINFEKTTFCFEIKCTFCGITKKYKNVFNFLYKKFPCDCMSNASQNKSKKYKEEILKKINCNEDFSFRKWATLNGKPAVAVYCKKCEDVFTRRLPLFLKNQDCPHCKKKGTPNTKVISERLKNKGYTLLSIYKKQNKKVLVKHDKCGFEWEITLNRDRELDGGCPYCNRRISKGEQRVYNFLEGNNIQFEREKRFQWQSHKKYRYDFFIPSFSLIIEFNGRQHYEETNLFKSTLQETKEHDETKKQEALKNGYNFLEISYLQMKEIDNILSKWFNDYPNIGVSKNTEKNIS